MKVRGTYILVIEEHTNGIKSGDVIVDGNKHVNKSCGKVLSIGDGVPKNLGVNIGETVFMSSDAGIYISKKNLPNHVVLDYRELVCVADPNADIIVGDDNTWLLESNNKSAMMLNKKAQH